MTSYLSERARWGIVTAFAIGMAVVEAACVLYLRRLVDRIEPYQPHPLPIDDTLGAVELWREAATLLMLAAVGALAGRSWRHRAAYACVAFGVWDVFYYVFLVPMTGWPHSFFDWDILFLIPLPWWGPVLAPASIAVLMIVWGTLVTQSPVDRVEPRWTWTASAVGTLWALAIFMADAWVALPGGREAVINVLPTSFPWPSFVAAVALMAAPVAWRLSPVRALSAA